MRLRSIGRHAKDTVVAATIACTVRAGYSAPTQSGGPAAHRLVVSQIELAEKTSMDFFVWQGVRRRHGESCNDEQRSQAENKAKAPLRASEAQRPKDAMDPVDSA
jgi:hypothetical protein